MKGTVDIDVFDRWNAPQHAHPNMISQTETLYKQEVPPGFRLSSGWLTDRAKKSNFLIQKNYKFQINEAIIPLDDF